MPAEYWQSPHLLVCFPFLSLSPLTNPHVSLFGCAVFVFVVMATTTRWTARAAAEGDAAAVHALYAAAFGQADEAELVKALTAAGAVVAAAVVEAQDSDAVVGAAHCSSMRLSGSPAVNALSVVALAPVAASPSCQRQGVGSAAVGAVLDAVKARGVDGVVVLGDAAYVRLVWAVS